MPTVFFRFSLELVTWNFPGVWPTKEELSGLPLIPWRQTNQRVDTTTHRQRNMQRQFGTPSWKRETLTWSRDHTRRMKQYSSATAPLKNYVRVLWQPLMRATRFARSMMAPGVEQIPRFKARPKREPQPPQCLMQFAAIHWLHAASTTPPLEAGAHGPGISSGEEEAGAMGPGAPCQPP